MSWNLSKLIIIIQIIHNHQFCANWYFKGDLKVSSIDWEQLDYFFCHYGRIHRFLLGDKSLAQYQWWSMLELVFSFKFIFFLDIFKASYVDWKLLDSLMINNLAMIQFFWWPSRIVTGRHKYPPLPILKQTLFFRINYVRSSFAISIKSPFLEFLTGLSRWMVSTKSLP